MGFSRCVFESRRLSLFHCFWGTKRIRLWLGRRNPLKWTVLFVKARCLPHLNQFHDIGILNTNKRVAFYCCKQFNKITFFFEHFVANSLLLSQQLQRCMLPQWGSRKGLNQDIPPRRWWSCFPLPHYLSSPIPHLLQLWGWREAIYTRNSLNYQTSIILRDMDPPNFWVWQCSYAFSITTLYQKRGISNPFVHVQSFLDCQHTCIMWIRFTSLSCTVSVHARRIRQTPASWNSALDSTTVWGGKWAVAPLERFT